MEFTKLPNSVFQLRNFPNLKSKFNTTKNSMLNSARSMNFENNNSMNSTGFSFDIKKNNLKTSKINSFLFSNNNNCDEYNEEKKMKNMYNKLSLWDNEYEKKTNLQNNKILELYNKENNILESYNRENKKQTELLKKKEEVDNFIKQRISILRKLPKVKSETNIFNDNLNENKLNYDIFLKEENSISKDQKRTEFKYRKVLMDLYENILLNKLKKRRYENILDDTYHLLDNARTESNLCIDILKERIKSVEKYYEAFINDNNKTQSNESKKKNRKKTSIEILEEKIKKYNEYIIIRDDILSEIKGYKNRLEEINKQLTKIIINSKEKIKECREIAIKYKYLFVELSNEQKKYYLDILKKGSDTRNEGLSWVIKRLLELKVNLDKSMFPYYLDNEQIDYLINISKLSFERSQLKLILNTLKHRHKKNRSDSNINITNFNEKRHEDNVINYIKGNLNPNIFSNKRIEQMQKLYVKYEDSTKNIITKKLEENEIKRIVSKHKKQIHQYAINKNICDDEEDNLLHNFMKNESQKKYFDDIIQINKRIKELNEFIDTLIKKEINILDDKIKFSKLRKGEESIDDFREKVFNSLFGKRQDK